MPVLAGRGQPTSHHSRSPWIVDTTTPWALAHRASRTPSLARRSSRTSRSISAMRCCSAVGTPGRWPPSTSAWRTQPCHVPVGVGRNDLVPLPCQPWPVPAPSRQPRSNVVSVRTRTKRLLPWSLWLASLCCCAAGLLATLLWVRPLTLGLLAQSAAGGAGLPARLRHHRAGAGSAAAGQPDRLAVRRLGPALGAGDPLCAPVCAGRRSPVAAAGLSAHHGAPGEHLGAGGRAGHHPAVPAAARRAAALAALAAGGGRHRGRGRHVHGGRQPDPRTGMDRPH